ncbi:MAG: UDP-N-acetylmuramoyl-tripeptide--D-alanyl-D-alanine ligase, partial [Kiloniellales bacterium]|nr:UDP-N-acetylmuramoyl-tripeptide--D-alanyl-D-alanine ligase [Kiloniellales bacterium]
DLFIALKGPNFDGHDYVPAAFAAGAAAAMVHKDPEDLPDDVPADRPLLRVGDTLKSLWALGTAARTRSRADFLGITGSVGKTGTKEALRVCLSDQALTAANLGSLNNHWGVPLSLARMAQDAVYGVFEMGMNHPGEIAQLSALVRPRIAVITNVEPAHIAFFSSVTEIAEAKAEIFEGVGEGGTAVLNRDHALFHLLRERAEAAGIDEIVGFGRHPEAEVRALEVALEPSESRVRARVLGTELDYRLSLPGAHWVANSLAVLAAVAAVGADLAKAAEALGRLEPLKGRGQRFTPGLPGGSFLLIDDSYNANPTSMRAAFQLLAQAPVSEGARRIAVLGDMLELGDESEARHVRLAPHLAALGIDLVFTCGPAMAALHEALPKAMRGGHTAESGSLAPLVIGALAPGDAVLVKGSAGSRMGLVVEALKSIETDPPRAANGE